MTNIALAPRGDVIFVLENDKNKDKVRMHVSSHTLSMASPVLKRMFNGSFAEGAGLSEDNPKEIPLPDDDCDSITLLCRLTHLQGNMVDRELPLSGLLTFAKVVDKYNCIPSVEVALHLWFQFHMRCSPALNELWMLAEASYLANSADIFRAATSGVAVTGDAADMDNWTIAEKSVIPFSAILQLSQQHKKAVSRIRQLIETAINTCCGNYTLNDHSKICTVVRLNLPLCLRCFQTAGVWPVSNLPESVDACLTKISNLSEARFDYGGDFCHGSCSPYPKSIVDFKKEAPSVRDICSGLCLDCVRSGKTACDENCRVPHT
ncbi:hypothetical protein NA57DRAFT_76357 [Rhizodiscina lignyota]|uniref:BTB domain-containing protein n=1 Tax=Rhizodiscina lignyota TaxID=1504668 RepID=A0A9P4IH77_9PEZI|nr:hypothetical protein NA57DRAFT_76357 [Rhizodiscina lignyota]